VRLKTSRYTWRWTLEIYCFDSIPDPARLVHQVAEILSGDFTLASDFPRVFSLCAKLLN
jgi:hypothetical protein